MRLEIQILSLFVSAYAMAGEVKAPADSTKATGPGTELLRKAAEATKQIKNVRYTFARQGLGADEQKAPKLSGTITFGGWAYDAVEKYRVEMKVQRQGSEPVNVVAGSDGQTVYLIDHVNKKVHADMDPAVLGAQASPVRVAMIPDFVDPTPFEDQLKAEAIVELVGTTKVGADDCHELRCRSEGSRGEVVWYLSIKDYMPRRLDLVFPSADGKQGGRRMELSNLEINPKLDGDPFQLVVPVGYTRTDDFAP